MLELSVSPTSRRPIGGEAQTNEKLHVAPSEGLRLEKMCLRPVLHLKKLRQYWYRSGIVVVASTVRITDFWLENRDFSLLS